MSMAGDRLTGRRPPLFAGGAGRIPAVLAVVAGLALAQPGPYWRLPVDCRLDSVRLTRIGAFGRLRQARPGVPAHLHTGVDIVRPSANYRDEPVYPAFPGVVISLRADGPYAQIILEHCPSDSQSLWTVYEHVSGIRCGLGDTVAPDRPMARFMDRRELDRHGWQFDHLHFEVMKRRPVTRPPDARLPFCRYRTFGLTCFSESDLAGRYHDPLLFLGNNPRQP